MIDFNRSDDELEGLPFTDDQSLTLKFDVWANQKYSPFLFFQKSFDNIVGLQDRMNYGLGGKSWVFLKDSQLVMLSYLKEKII